MIELNYKTQQDFLNREWIQRLLDAGVNMSDASYYIVEEPSFKCDIITTLSSIDRKWTLEEVGRSSLSLKDYINKFKGVPTYTVSELLYKLHEWIYPTIDGEEYSGGLIVAKDAPFYFAFYNLKNKEDKKKTEKFFAEFEYPIESLASLLIQCHKKDIGMERKDTGNISNK
jgi:hypothetical protein